MPVSYTHLETPCFHVAPTELCMHTIEAVSYTHLFSALMVAVCVALSYARSIPIFYNIRITWGFLGRALCAMVCGPVNALAFGFVEDTVSYFMNPDGGYNPAYVITTMLGALTYALFFYRAKVTVTRLFLAKLVTNLQNVFLGSLWTYLWYTDQGYWAVVGASAMKNTVCLLYTSRCV